MKKISFVSAFLFIVFTSFFQSGGVCQAEDIEELADEGWGVIESKYCTILCHPEVDIKRVNKKIRIRFYDIELDKGFYSSNDDCLEQKLAEKFDRIFIKAEKILDMYPRRIHLKVKIYKGQSQLDEEYALVFNQPNKERRISYYVHKYTTIYTTERVIREGVLAHEMGHAISDHYFVIPPPERIKELMAQYVEMHLDD